MKVEEKIARAYHHELSWRKVLVRLEPDAHNNMVVRRMFANAYGWDVVKHVCDTHFANTVSAQTRDEDESSKDRAMGANEAAEATGEQVHGQTEGLEDSGALHRTRSEVNEIKDEVPDLSTPAKGAAGLTSSGSIRKLHDNSTANDGRSNSAQWSDSVFENQDTDSDSDEDREIGPFETFQRRFWAPVQKPQRRHSGDHLNAPRSPPKLTVQTPTRRSEQYRGTSDAEIAAFLTQSPVEVHRGLGIVSGETATAPALSVNRTRPRDVVPERNTGTTTTGELGLRKPLEAHMRPEAYRRGESNVGEQVARAQHAPSKR